MKWNLQGLKFLLSHIEGFVDGEWQEVRERARTFAPQTGLDKIQALAEPVRESEPPTHLLDRLAPFYESGLLLQDWKVTDIFWRGSVFHLEPDEQRPAELLANTINPSQVFRAPADKILCALELEFLASNEKAEGFLFKPTPNVGLVLFSTLATPWLEDHVRHTQRLINKAFLY